MKKLFPLLLMLCCTICAKATVTIGGKTLTSGTLDSSSGCGITFGTISLSGTTLTLTNVTMSSTSPCINANSSLTIKLVGTNTLTSTNEAVLKLANTASAQTFNITSDNGRGKLTATSTSSAALRNEKSNITFEQCEVELVGKNYSVWTQQTTVTEIINVTNAHLTIKNTEGATSTLQKLDSLNLEGCSLASGYVFSKGGVRTSASGSFVKGTIEFLPDKYPIYVKGTQITSLIKHDVIGNGKGSVMYDPNCYSDGAGLLMLVDAEISASYANAITFTSEAKRALVWCKGTNTVKTNSGNGYSAIYSEVPLTIWSNPNENTSLVLNNNYDNYNSGYGYSIMSKGNVTIRNLTLTACARNPLSGLGSPKLTFDNANASFARTSTEGHAVSGFASVSYSGCYISSPKCVTYDTTNKLYTKMGDEISQLGVSKGTDDIGPAIYWFTPTSVGHNTASFKWDMEDNMTAKQSLKMSYNLSINNGTKTVQEANLSNGATSISLSGLTARTTYILQIIAEDAAGNKGYFNNEFTTADIQDYKIKIAGTSVTSLNYSSIPVASGSGNYDPSSNTLTLNNATINGGSNAAIYSESEGLTIKINGKCYLNTTNNAPIVTAATTGTTYIIGDSYKETQLYLSSGKGYLNMNNYDAVAIKKISLKGNGSISGSTSNPLIVGSSRISLEGSVTGYSSINLLSGLTLKKPLSGKYVNYKLLDANGKIATGCEIGPKETYDLKILGNSVTYSNCSDILGDGTVKYDPIDNVLTLRNANLTADNSTQYVIEAQITGLTIKVEGTNTVTADHYCLYHNASDITIKGDSRNDKLYLNSEEYSLFGYNLTIKDCTVEANNTVYGLSGNLVVDNANVKAHTIIQYANVEMKNGVKVLWPTGATYRKASNGIMRHGIGDRDVYNVFLGIEADDVDYGISVAGTAVKYSNCTDVFSSAGSVSYDNSTSTLTLKAGSIHVPAGSKAIKKTSGDLNIVVDGLCNFSSENWDDVIETSGDVYVRGYNSDLEEDCLYFYHRDGDTAYGEGQHITFSKSLSVRNCKLMVCGPINGNSSYSMNIDNAVVDATNIKGFGQILMENEYVSSSPVSHYDSTQKAFCYANGDEAEHVVISPAPLYVNNIAVTPENAKNILDGISYNFDTNILTFSGSASYPWSIRSAGNLIIQVEGGFNMIQQSDESNTNMGINCGGDLTIRGFGSLMVTGYGKGIVCDGNLYVKDVNLMVYSTDIAIRALNDVTLNGASVEMSATAENGMCIYCKDIYLQDCKVEKPTDITISDESSWTKFKSIKYAKINADRTFSLYIAGTAVTDQNKNDVLGDGGTVTYDPTNGTLYLKNATIKGGDTAHAIQDYQNDLKIELSGENTLFSNYGAPIATTGSVSISGEITKDYSSNILRISHTEDWTSSIGCRDKASIFNCSVYADKISSSQGTDTIEISEAYVESGIANFAYVSLKRAYIETDCHYDTANKKFVDGNNAEVSTVVIRPIILRVGGIDVTKNNCSDIFGDQTASYDFGTKVLTLHNANITNGNINSICQLEIKLEGENTLAFDDSTTSGIETARGKLTINGPGSLTVTNTVILIAKWVQDEEPVTIQNCTLNSTACNNGIINSNSPIVINNSNVNFPRCNPFIGLSLTLENCHSVNQTEADLVESLKEWDWTDDPVKIVADIILGDVNNDGKVNIADIPDLITLLTPKGDGTLIYKLRYDANSDGKINVKDIKAIENRILGK